MDDRVVQFRVGVMVLATLLIAVILILLFGSGGRTLLKSRYPINVTFADAPGVGEGTPIKKSGVLIGRVGSIQLTDRGVLVVVEIDKERKLRRNETFSVNTSILGDATLEVVPARGKAADDTTTLEPGDSITGVVRPNAAKVISNLETGAAEVMSSVAMTSESMGAVAKQLSKLMVTNEQKVNNIIAQTDEATAMLRDAMRSGRGLLGDPRTAGDLKRAIAQAPELFETTRKTLEQMNQTMILVNRNLDAVSRFTGSLGDKGAATVAQLSETSQKFDRLVAELLRLTETINRGDGTLGQMVNNPELYKNLNRASENVEQLTRQVRPILNDLRVFSDKIARHPESLGVRGAIKPDKGTKWPVKPDEETQWR